MRARALVVLALVGWGSCGGGAAALAASAAAAASGPNYALLDTMAERADACDQAVEKDYATGVPVRMTAALEVQARCLEDVAAALAAEFYPPDAFGDGGIRARVADLRATYGRLYGAVHTRPLTCRGRPCGDIYQVWAAEAYVSAVRALVDSIIDRVKDQSPLHQP
ncbi:hypothetical protein [Caenispirillum bisanense]|uniref:hypothetical protein n=1 Tax=Caenispirillum bisanense TaxID=414052 RepID=UPI0031E20405